MRTIPLTKGYTTLVSDRDFARVSKLNWHASVTTHSVYARHSVSKGTDRGKVIYLHRFILGVTSPKVEVDHRNGNGLHNNRRNLRKSSHAQNLSNRGKTKANTSGHKGVYWAGTGRRKPWRACLAKKTLGYFVTPKLAAAAYGRAARKLFGRFYVA